jgi:hypothetical protein
MHRKHRTGLIAIMLAATPFAHADSWSFGITPIPNWALGSPQPATIGVCSNIDPFATCGAGVSDRLSIGLLTRGVTTRVSAEVPGPLGTAFPASGLRLPGQGLSHSRFRSLIGFFRAGVSGPTILSLSWDSQAMP